MAIASVSEKAIARAREIDFRGYYLDYLELYETIKKTDYQYISTPALPMMYAMDYQLDKILAEGLENRFKRHEELAEMTRSWARKHFKLYAKDEWASNTVTTVTNTLGLDIDQLNEELGKRGFQISNGYADLKNKTFRIGHMADCTLKELQELLDTLDEVLGFNYKDKKIAI
jgi:aspartate aminotransferase-like enzyme